MQRPFNTNAFFSILLISLTNSTLNTNSSKETENSCATLCLVAVRYASGKIRPPNHKLDLP